MTEAIFKSRREFLEGTAAVMTTAGLPISALAASAHRRFAGRPLLVLYRSHDVHATVFADEFHHEGFATLALSDDPVRQWRDGLGRLLRDDNLLLIGLTNWSDYAMLRGLAAEERRHPLFESRQYKQVDSRWAREHAQALLSIANAGDACRALGELSTTSQTQRATPALFSWAL
ncbi:MAG: hypothetical protein ACO1PZ_10980 [Gammaproteobacteria bacterium]